MIKDKFSLLAALIACAIPGLLLDTGSAQLLYAPAVTVATPATPGGVAFRPGGGFAVTVPVKKEVRLYKADGSLETAFGVGGRPVSVAVLNNGDILVGDGQFGEVARYDLTGKKIGFLGKGYQEVKDPADIDIDRALHRIYVVDSRNHHVRVFNWDGEPITTIGTKGALNGQFDMPVSIAVQPSTGAFCVLEFKNQRVQIFNANGTFSNAFGIPGNEVGQIFRPGGVTVDGQGRVLVSDAFNGWVQAFSNAGTYLGQCAVYGKENGKLVNPGDIGIDVSNRLLVSALGSIEVEVFNNLAPGGITYPTDPEPAVRAAVITHLDGYLDMKSEISQVGFRVEFPGANVHMVNLGSVKLNATINALTLQAAAGPQPATFHAFFRHAELVAMVKAAKAKDSFVVTVTGTLVGGGKFSGLTEVFLDKKNKPVMVKIKK